MKNLLHFVFISFLLTTAAITTTAQPSLQKDYSTAMEIPDIITMDSSPAHLYVLSEDEGMVVFRARTDSLQWLYASTGMEQRGHTMNADIRFAYLYGDSRRLTVLEPTSVLGVYSSTVVPDRPRDAVRMEEKLYVALGSRGLGQLSLSTPAAVDSTVSLVERSRMREENIVDLETSSDQLFALSTGSRLFIFNQDNEELVLDEELELEETLHRIFVMEGNLMGSDEEGNIYEISSSGSLARLGSIGEPVEKMEKWNEWLIIRGDSDRLWTSYQNRSPTLWKDDPDAGNHFTVNKGNLWVAENNQLSRILVSEEVVEEGSSQQSGGGSQNSTLELKPIEDQVMPYQMPLLLALELENPSPPDEVRFTYRSSIDDAEIRGNGFYWQPGSGDTGTHRFRIIASSRSGQTDSTSFEVEVRNSNSPPRFSPVRSISIPIGEQFELPIRARDPDGASPDLIRYMGVDLPEGAELDERTGTFTWTPSERQEGENSFQVIATDQFGAASELNVTLNAVEAGGTENDTTGSDFR